MEYLLFVESDHIVLQNFNKYKRMYEYQSGSLYMLCYILVSPVIHNRERIII